MRFILFFLACTIASGQERIAVIDFYGTAGDDLSALRAALPVQEGDSFSTLQELFDSIGGVEPAIRHAIGKDPTEIAPVCCYGQRDWMVFIGLPGSSPRTKYNPTPTGRQRLPKSATDLYTQIMDSLIPLLQAGKADEDGSTGYALAKDPALRAKQMEIRAYARANEPLLMQVLKSSGTAFDRGVAAHFLGYAEQSSRQLTALTRAVKDPDATVRNNATRALDVLVGSKPQLAERIDPTPYIAMLSSGVWRDRNKASIMVSLLTERRSPKLLTKIRKESLQSLLEMAQWRSKNHAQPALTILGRMAGIEEKRLQDLLASDQRDEILRAVRQRP